MKTIPLAGAAAALLLATAPGAPVHAHVTLEAGEANAGSTYKAVLRVPHGCDGQATHTLKVEIPEGFIAVKPMPKAGWTTTVGSGAYERPHNYYGRTLSEGVREVTWSGGALPDDFYDEFVFRGYVADVPAGTKLYFNATQLCAAGEVGWTEIAAAGQDPHDLKHPAPALRVTAAENRSEHGSGHAGHGAAGMHAAAGSASVGDVAIEGAYARPSLGKAPNSAVYMTLRTSGAADRLVSAASPAAEAVEIHTSEMDSRGVMTMRPVEAVPVEPGAAAELKPGGYHIMLVGLVAPLEEGSTIPVTLSFEKAGDVTMEVPVGKAEAGHDHHGTMHK